MRFSSNFGTAVHILFIINEYSKTRKITSDIIAEFIGTGPVAVRKISGLLKKAGFINIAPSREKEGTTLALPPDKIKLVDIFEVMEPNCVKILTETNSRHANTYPTGLYANEIISGYIEDAVSAFKDELGKTTLADFLAAVEKKEAEGPYDDSRKLFNDLKLQQNKLNGEADIL